MMKKEALYHSDKVRRCLIVPASVDPFRSNSHRVWPESGLRIMKCRTAWPVGKASPSQSGRWVLFLFLTHKRARLSRSYPEPLFFSLNVQHHCRHCGNIFCAECSSRNALTPSSKKPVRVCETCFEELQGWFSFVFPPLISLTLLTRPLLPPPIPTLPFPSSLPYPFYSNGQKKACLCHF